MAIPSQYRNFQTPPVNELANLSPLQLALIYYMREGQEVPFFINHDWLRALTTFADSGIISPDQVGGSGPIVIDNTVNPPKVFTIEPKPDCGPDDTDRYEKVERSIPPIKYWVGEFLDVVRGGSAADGAGGPWATGGLNGPDTSPGNGADLPPPIYSDAVTQYGAPAADINSPIVLNLNQQAAIVTSGRTETNGVPAKTETEITQELFQNNIPVYLQGIA